MRLLIIIAILHLITGCTFINYRAVGQDTYITGFSLGSDRLFGSLVMTNGARQLSISGFNENQSKGAGAVAQGVVMGTIKGLK